MPLAAVGAVRVVADVLAGYLYALGRSRGVLVVQVVWLVALVPAAVVGARLGGSVGVGVAQAVVSVAVLVPAYLVLLRRSRDEVGALARALAVPGAAAVGAVVAGMLVADRVDDPLLGGLLGGATTLCVYVATTVAWVMPRWRAVRAALDGPDDEPASAASRPTDEPSGAARPNHRSPRRAPSRRPDREEPPHDRDLPHDPRPPRSTRCRSWTWALQTAEVEHDVRERWDQILRTSGFVLGPEVDRFEREFAAYSGARHAVGVGNGTDALEIGLPGGGDRPGRRGDRPGQHVLRDGGGRLRCGAMLVPADVDDDFLLDPQDVAERLTARTRAVVAVHLYGQMAPVARLREVVGPDVLLVEDAAQSQGASRDGLRSGGVGRRRRHELLPGQEPGRVRRRRRGPDRPPTTSPSGRRRLRNHGGVNRYEHLEVGRQLAPRHPAGRRPVREADPAGRVERCSGRPPRPGTGRCSPTRSGTCRRSSAPRELPGPRTCGTCTWCGRRTGPRCPPRSRRRDRARHPLPGPGPPAAGDARTWASARAPPAAEAHADRILSLPMFPGITAAQQEHVVSTLHSAVTGRAAPTTVIP